MATPTSNTPARLMAPTTIANGADTLYYTSPASPAKGTRLTAAIFCNITAASAKVKLWLTTGGVPASADALAFDLPIPSDGGPVVLPLSGIVMNASDRIYARSDTASAVNLQLFGIEMA